MEIVKINIKEIKPYENNVKRHPKQQIEQIKHSIVEFGNNDPIAIDENNVIIEGHGRYFALQELGYEKVECIVLKNLTEEQKKAYRLVHNKLTMNSDFDIAGLEEELKKIVDIDISKYDFDLKEIEKQLSQLNDENREVEEDNFDVDSELNSEEEPIAKYGDIYQLGNHRLMCGDSTNKEDVDKLIEENHADLLITDPPYNVDYEGSNGLKIENDNLNEEKFIQFLTNCFSNVKNALKNGASFYIWYANRKQFAFETALRNSNMQYREILIWNKNSFTFGISDYHWKHEPCFYGWVDGGAHKWYGDRSQTTVLNFDKPQKNDLHPTMKPVNLIAYLIKNSSKQEDIVLDVFGGSGSTLIACEQLNRNCYMMELDPKYVDVIIERWEKFTGQKAIKIN